MRIITLYSKDRCVQCKASETRLKTKGVDFKADGDSIQIGNTLFLEKDATTEENLAFVKSLDHLQAPVMTVEIDGEIVDHWSGFRPDKIDELAA